MPPISFKKIFASSVLIAGATFSVLTLPLLVVGSRPITIQLNDEPLFVGKLKDIAAPYIGLATALGVSAGIVNFSLAGWKNSTSKSQKVVEKLSGLEQQLKEKEAQLEEVLVSESRLQAVGLDAFLDPPTLDHFSRSGVIPMVVQSPVLNNQIADLPSENGRQNHQFPHSQNGARVLSVAAHPVASSSAADTTASSLLRQLQGQDVVPFSSPTVSQIQQLQEQLQQIVSQVEQLQNSLQTGTEASLDNLSQSELTNIVLHHLNHRLHRLESKRSPQEMAS
jgi:TolA-binding protein